MDEYNHPSDPWEQHSYGNGSTQPPKSHGGLIAVLLVLVILLGGISSALGILNIRLFSMLESQRDPDDDFHFEAAASQEGTFLQTQEEPTVPAEIRDALKARLGVDGEEVSGFYQHYYQLPAGLLITAVLEKNPAGDLDLQSGDILIRINSTRVTSPQEAVAALDALPTGQPASLVLFRTGKEITVPFTPISEGSGE